MAPPMLRTSTSTTLVSVNSGAAAPSPCAVPKPSAPMRLPSKGHTDSTSPRGAVYAVRDRVCFEPAADGRRQPVLSIERRRQLQWLYAVKTPTIAIPFHKLLKVWLC